jgi:sRNA-binding protein
VPDERDRDQISSPQASKMPSPLKAHVRRPQGEKQAFFSKKKEEEGKKKPPYRPRSQSELLPKHPSFHLPHADFNPSNLAFSTLSSSTGGASSYVLRAYYQGYGAVAVKVIDISKCGLRSQLETELQVRACVRVCVCVCVCLYVWVIFMCSRLTDRNRPSREAKSHTGAW